MKKYLIAAPLPKDKSDYRDLLQEFLDAAEPSAKVRLDVLAPGEDLRPVVTRLQRIIDHHNREHQSEPSIRLLADGGDLYIYRGLKV